MQDGISVLVSESVGRKLSEYSRPVWTCEPSPCELSSKFPLIVLSCGPDAEEEEDQPQFESSSGSPHRLGDGLTRTPTALRVHQVRPRVVRMF